MNLDEPRYSRYALVREMMETLAVVRNFDPECTRAIAAPIQAAGRLLLTGEGSSRIFPAKNAIRKALTRGLDLTIVTEGSRQAAQYDLSRFAVFCASNSGRTREAVMLASKLAGSGTRRFALCARSGSPLEKVCDHTLLLRCGAEAAVAATKSVVEQALVYESLLWHLGTPPREGWQEALALHLHTALTLRIPPALVLAVAKAPLLYFAGYNDGVAEELTLKTNEIIRKKSDFLEGTYAAHGIEEVMNPEDVVIVVDPIEEEIGKFREVLVQGVGLTVIAIASRITPFPTILVPDAGEMNPYLYLGAGWNLLVETGLTLGIDLDKPVRARKVGNEFSG
ncbi:MAG TPA: SIS domain-containing protein [bacterium]|nr:SIS domain-containing protein [bacterium]HQG44457.1 SIS domain-containing protein [bacterium]HQI49388.1 SIS domain-containing protein [bacterium]HQJ65335.1 SIS domain-containing protein [bacterium]